MKPCPCNSNKSYEACCARYITGEKPPSTPEALMRSRYTAYTLAKLSYITKTQAGEAARNFDRISAKRWAKKANWLGLEVVAASIDPDDPTHGWVEFIATYAIDSQQEVLHELSEFSRIEGHWYYIAGQCYNPNL